MPPQGTLHPTQTLPRQLHLQYTDNQISWMDGVGDSKAPWGITRKTAKDIALSDTCKRFITFEPSKLIMRLCVSSPPPPLATWQLGNLATWQLGNLAAWQLVILRGSLLGTLQGYYAKVPAGVVLGVHRGTPSHAPQGPRKGPASPTPPPATRSTHPPQAPGRTPAAGPTTPHQAVGRSSTGLPRVRDFGPKG